MIFLYIIAIFQATLTITGCGFIIYFLLKRNDIDRRKTPMYTILWVVSYMLLSLRILAVAYFKEDIIDFSQPVIALFFTVVTVIAFLIGNYAMYRATKNLTEKRFNLHEDITNNKA